MKSEAVPSLFEWVGGSAALERLFTLFYAKVPADPLLAPVFAGMSPDHQKHVAAFVGEVFGGPKTYSGEHGGHSNMVKKHVGRALDEQKRKRWTSSCSNVPTKSACQAIRSSDRRSSPISSGARASPSSTRSRAPTSAPRLPCRRGAGAK